MDEIIYQKSYQEYKAELDGELQKTAEGFVRIGYLLKVARDTNILAESGYSTVSEFAEAEYNLNKTQVSRFISINDKFSEGGYSDHLLDEYKGFGYAKLTIMLQLPDAINEELTPDFSKADIQAIKEEVEEEKAVSDIEVILESASAGIHLEESEIEKTVKKIGEDDPELFKRVWEAHQQQLWDKERLQSIMAPAGLKTILTRIPGIGRKMLIMRDSENGNEVVLVDVRSNDKQKFTWTELKEAWERFLAGKTVEDAWENLYYREWPLKTEIAPVQQKVEKKQEETKPKKESKVTKAPVKKPEPEAVVEPEKPEEEQIPGQDNIMQHPEYLPKGMKAENITENTEIVDELPMNPPIEPVIEPEEIDIQELWRTTENSSREVYMFFNIRNAAFFGTSDCQIERLKELYKHSVDVAAALERMINVKEHSAE